MSTAPAALACRFANRNGKGSLAHRFMIILADLDPALGVPDALYEVLHWEPSNEEQTWAGYVLRLHRDILNGGFEQALFNLEAVDEAASVYISAYRQLALLAGAAIVQNAADALGCGDRAKLDLLDERYGRLTYGANVDQPDAIEEAVILFAKRISDRFCDAIVRANAW